MDLRHIREELVSRFNNPVRPKLEQVALTLRGISDVDEAWAVAISRGLIAREDANDLHREYAISDSKQLIRASDRFSTSNRPPNVDAILTMMSDIESFMLAEHHARELTRRLAPWGAVGDNKVVWHFANNPYERYPYEVVYLSQAFNSARDTIMWSISSTEFDAKINPIDMQDQAMPLIVKRTLQAWYAWEFAAGANLSISEPAWPLSVDSPLTFAELSNPFRPLLELWCTGYRYYAPLSRSDRRIRLYASPAKFPP